MTSTRSLLSFLIKRSNWLRLGRVRGMKNRWQPTRCWTKVLLIVVTSYQNSWTGCQGVVEVAVGTLTSNIPTLFNSCQCTCNESPRKFVWFCGSNVQQNTRLVWGGRSAGRGVWVYTTIIPFEFRTFCNNSLTPSTDSTMPPESRRIGNEICWKWKIMCIQRLTNWFR